jgi:hypothetical protein
MVLRHYGSEETVVVFIPSVLLYPLLSCSVSTGIVLGRRLFFSFSLFFVVFCSSLVLCKLPFLIRTRRSQYFVVAESGTGTGGVRAALFVYRRVLDPRHFPAVDGISRYVGARVAQRGGVDCRTARAATLRVFFFSSSSSILLHRREWTRGTASQRHVRLSNATIEPHIPSRGEEGGLERGRKGENAREDDDSLLGLQSYVDSTIGSLYAPASTSTTCSQRTRASQSRKKMRISTTRVFPSHCSPLLLW